MVRRLVFDAVLRERRSYLIWSVQVALFATTREPSNVYFTALAIAIAGAVLLSFATMSALKNPVITLLPASRQTLWRSEWWLGTIVPAAIVAFASMIGLLTRCRSRAPKPMHVQTRHRAAGQRRRRPAGAGAVLCTDAPLRHSQQPNLSAAAGPRAARELGRCRC